MDELIKLVQWLLDFTPLFTAQLLLILLVRKPVQQKFGPVAAYQLWLLPIAWFSSIWILNSISGQLLENTLNNHALHVPPVSELLTASSVIIQPVVAIPVEPDALWQLVTRIWLTGLALTFTAFVISATGFQEYFNKEGKRCTSGQIRKLVVNAGFPETLPVVMLGKNSSPALYGVVEHCLLLPDDFLVRFNEEQRKAVLAHEHVHYLRKDNPLNFLAQSLRMLFWFNPLIYFAYRRYRFDQELSCDSCVLQGSNNQQRRHYAEALLCSLSGRKYDALGLSSWNGRKFLKQRTQMLASCHIVIASTKAKIILLSGLLLLGTLGSSLIRSQEPVARQFLNAEIIPPSLLDSLAEVIATRGKESPQPVRLRYDEGQIPADSEYLVFVVDASASLINSPNWDSTIGRLRDIVAQYKNLRGIQVINDTGDYLNNELSQQWVNYDSEAFQSLYVSMSDWRPLSKGSPVEGIREAVTNLIKPGQKVSLYVIGDNLSQPIEGAASEIDRILAASSIQTSDIRIHTLMIPTFILGNSSQKDQENAYKYLSLMYGISQRNGGTFELYGIY